MLTRRNAVLVFAAAGLRAQTHPVEPPAGAGSGMPFLTTGPDGVALLSWIEPRGEKGHAMRLARYRDGAWGEPWEVAAGDNWFINWADFPSVTRLESGTVLAHWEFVWLAPAAGKGNGRRVSPRLPAIPKITRVS